MKVKYVHGISIYIFLSQMYIRVGFLRIPATQEKITWHSFQHAYNRKPIFQYPRIQKQLLRILDSDITISTNIDIFILIE